MSYLTGKAFEEELVKDNLGHEPLVAEFIYKDTNNLIYAATGHGKSVITANLVVGALTENMVFGYLPSRINKVAYWQTEGSRSEQFGRLQAMQNKYGPIPCDRISWHTIGIAIEDRRTWDGILKELDEVRDFDLFVIDPIYSLAGEGVMTERFCSSLRGFCDKIRNDFGAAVLMNHHTPKDVLTPGGKKITKDTPYGLRWIDGNLDGMYYFNQVSKNKSYLERRKNRPQSLIERLTLRFDIANWTVTVIEKESTVTALQKVRSFVLRKFGVNSFTTAAEICRTCDISRRHLRRMKTDGEFDDFVKFMGEEGKEETWTKKT